jgi:hypothetical protein
MAHFEEKIAKTIKIFFVKEVRSGSDTIILDPDPRHCNFGCGLNFSNLNFCSNYHLLADSPFKTNA